MSWQYWIARQLRGGATLYRDIVEVNPPLWFWAAVPISALAERLHLDPNHLVIVSVMAQAACSLLLVAKLTEDRPARAKAALLCALALLLCVLPLHDFAEREHLMLIGLVPYAALAARRRDGSQAVEPRLAALTGLFAACGFALKPHFALMPIALECWLAAGLRSAWRPLRPETICLALVAAVYAVAVLLFAPDYLRLTLPLARTAYGAFSPPFRAVLEQIWTPFWLLAFVALARARAHLDSDAQAAMGAALALVALYLIQGRGFPYHALPATAMLGWALVLLVAREEPRIADRARYMLAMPALALLAVTVGQIGAFQPYRAGRASDALEHMPAGSIVAVISAHSWLAFPLVEERRFIWPMRNIGLWTLPKIAREANGATATRAGLRVRRETLDVMAADLWCHPPDAMLFDDPSRSLALDGTGFSYEAFFRSDPRLRSLIAHYRPVVSDEEATLYRRLGSLAARGARCRRISVRPDVA